tara:strand:- start:1256 stop:2230 length:975 start_codon:yes stop_codon:yes gene_type:complete
MSLYQILELEPSASISDIKKSYRKLAKKYHPDKNKDEESILKFQKINSAYEILQNDDSRRQYLMLNSDSKSLFQDFLEKIFNNNLSCNNLEKFGINLNKNDYQYLEQNLYQMINSLNLNEIMNFFKSGEFPKKDYDFNSACSDSEVISWGVEDPFYFFDLPVEIQKHNPTSLRISLNVTLDEILSSSKKSITLKRQIDNKFVNTNFEFYLKSPWIFFSGGGDSNSDNIGDLIIKLNLPEKYEWHSDLIIYQHNISLYEYVYGVSLNLKIGNKKIEYENWVPSREGNVIFIDHVLNDYKKNFSIKFILNYNDTEDKKNLLRNYFN